MHLRPSAQALYPVLRTFAFFDPEAYDGSPDDSWWKSYRNRKFDFVNMDFDVMAEYAGITERSLDSALNSLSEHDLLAEVDEATEYDLDFYSEFPTWAVYVDPEYRYKRDYLNELTAKRYGINQRKVKKKLRPKKIDKKIVSRNVRSKQEAITT
jgi:hypothetical protein